jgi:hypothetical protein
VEILLRRHPRLITAAILAAAAYSVVHLVVSGIIQPLRTPAIGQVIEELQPLYRLFTAGAATVDHPRQYGPVFLALFHPVYRVTLTRPDLLAWYAYALDVIAIVVAFIATRRAIRRWASVNGVVLPRLTTPALLFLWVNFSPLYGVLAVKNAELWELALIAVAGAALLEDRRWVAAWAIAAAALTKMLPVVFVPYLLLRDRRTFIYTLVALGAIIAISQLLYGHQMGFGYGPMIVRAALGGEDFGWRQGVWHENISIRGLASKAFGYLEEPGQIARYQTGYFVIVPPHLARIARVTGLVAEAAAVIWFLWQLLRDRSMKPFNRAYWEWALVAIMMMVLAPQISQDYMVLTLGAFSYVLAGCIIRADKWLWAQYAAAVLLVGNILPRALFARLLGINQALDYAKADHLLPAEGYQYFGFPLLGLLILLHVWSRVADDSRA